MVMSRTSAVEISVQAVSPLFRTGSSAARATPGKARTMGS